MTSDELECRRRELVAQVALQRVELRGRVRVLRAHGPVSLAMKALRVAAVAAWWWEIGRLAWRLAAAVRRK
jgi:hypothetical protein